MIPIDLFRQAQRGSITARNAIVLENMGLVRKIAREYLVPGVRPDVEDLVNVGAMAVIRAIRTYDSRLAAFSTYAGRWIRAEMRRECRKQRRAVTICEHATLAATVGIDAEPIGSRRREHMRLVLAAHDQPVRLDAPLHGGDHGRSDERILDNMPGPNGSPHDGAVKARNADLVHLAIAGLPPRQRTIMRRRMADETLAEIGRDMGITRERVRQLEAKAVGRLRHVLEGRVDL